MTRRILSVWLPHWPITRLTRSASVSPDRPLVTVETTRGVRHLVAVGVAGEAQGLRSGQTLTDARAVCPALIPVDADPVADEAALASLATWCERYTPLAAPDPPDGLWLDISGCTAVFATEAALAGDLAGRLERHGIPCRLAVAGTTGAAWALAHTGTDRSILPPGQEGAALADLPVTSLRLDAGTVTGLRRLGLRTVQDLLRIPRAQVTPRFGALPVLRLDQALGAMEEAIDWPRPPIEWHERLVFVEPIGTPEDLARALSQLAERLCRRLGEQGKGGQRFVARFFRVDEAVPQIAVTTALPVRDAGYLGKLLHDKLDTVDPGFGIEVIALEAETVAPLQAPQAQLTDLAASDITSSLAGVVDTLANRLGSDRVSRVAPHASHVPERAVKRVPPLPVRQPSWTADPAAPRPIRLLRRPEEIEVIALVPDDPPVRFRWRGVSHRVRAAAGPERIAAEWWRKRSDKRPETDLIRDYYRVEDSDGARFWIFRAGLHAEDRMPRWYLHGLFG
ncbi:MAG TPA: DNA polymerase Y family protein [Acetobacteraceae bacterium]|jgi:protein ImuB|nr:DNA polymerase Y family protein [Acetobacteraceae bacterium]